MEQIKALFQDSGMLLSTGMDIMKQVAGISRVVLRKLAELAGVRIKGQPVRSAPEQKKGAKPQKEKKGRGVDPLSIVALTSGLVALGSCAALLKRKKKRGAKK